ncbi:hypothetical protein HID58_087321, partial [Brassica napus]
HPRSLFLDEINLCCYKSWQSILKDKSFKFYRLFFSVFGTFHIQRKRTKIETSEARMRVFFRSMELVPIVFRCRENIIFTAASDSRLWNSTAQKWKTRVD